MMSTGELRELSAALRANQRQCDGELVDRIAADVEAYREVLRDRPTQLPPGELYERLPLMGWLIYEASWDCLPRVEATAGGETTASGARPRGETDLDMIIRLADCARELPWPEFAPRALGALRALALAESKRDTESGYDAAWALHEDVRKRYAEHRDSHGDDEAGRQFVRSLDEVFLQLALAETGTACRTAERVVARWAEQFAKPDPEADRAEQQRWVQRMFTELTAGVEVGERALDAADRIEKEHGFTQQVDEHRLAMPTARQNPGIMTARAASLLLALGPAMADLGRSPAGFGSWERWERATLARFERAYRAIEAEVVGEDGSPAPMSAGFQRQLVHVRLNLALLKPGYDLPSSRAGDLPCLAANPLDGRALEEMSAWLGDGRRRGRERALGAATMPLFIASLEACRGLGAGDDSYQQWRLRWFSLDQDADKPGRLDRVRQALAAARSYLT